MFANTNMLAKKDMRSSARQRFVSKLSPAPTSMLLFANMFVFERYFRKYQNIILAIDPQNSIYILIYVYIYSHICIYSHIYSHICIYSDT